MKGDVNGAVFAQLTNLETLNVSSNPKLAGRAPREIGIHLKCLKRLDLSHTGLVATDDLRGAVMLNCPGASVTV